MENAKIADKLVKLLDLRHEPVAVKVIKKGEKIPEGFNEPEKNIRHCQSIMRARKGESFVIPAGKHACMVGASSLGLVPLPTKVKEGEFHSNLGMFDCSDAAANMICQRSEFEEESTIATVVGPLKEFKTKPDVVILVDLPETLYWLIPAATYFEGGRQAFSTAAFQATCVDSTIIPITSGEMNMSLGCYGCRRSTDIENDEMIAGIPYKNLEKIIEALEKISDGPMQKARQK
ncbi:MAG: hypothetical protein PWQ51_2130 [Methanolobus sp.]|jgi:uncharacterized protein (DUF169 family)|uniref:DUF169 domain-containing protein n=1 Tax=Methanolobus tindarius DSM 2278 TaxID=1090322 RepID=W9DPF3_METTI|nr:DUF169 domain-containing protein [Methanolobus tindarius]ETA67083.1 hypothetical protein MettiDRAFT_0493 [Methanolobus tindarius DSM 2278]MDK2939965.1 hypothetical protein [Methanolobus sp.]